MKAQSRNTTFAVEIIDTGADLTAYANFENQSGCCSPPSSGLAVAGYAASVRVFAVKP